MRPSIKQPIESDVLEDAIRELFHDVRRGEICTNAGIEVLVDLFESEWQNAYLIGQSDKVTREDMENV